MCSDCIIYITLKFVHSAAVGCIFDSPLFIIFYIVLLMRIAKIVKIINFNCTRLLMVKFSRMWKAAMDGVDLCEPIANSFIQADSLFDI
jgi:hypothetical protein